MQDYITFYTEEDVLLGLSDGKGRENMDECARYDIVISGITSGISHPYRRLDW